VITEPGATPRNRPSSRAIMPSIVSAIRVTPVILVSALVYCAGSSTKSNTSCAVTPVMNSLPSPRIMFASAALSFAGAQCKACAARPARLAPGAVAGVVDDS
jgi:hypothetical protein